MTEQEGAAAAEHLTAEEVLAAFEALSSDDKMKLIAIERKFLGGTGRQDGELYRDALCRALLDERHCPRDVPVIAFLIETMRSIASHDREQQARLTSLDPEDVPATDAPQLSSSLASDQLNPEAQLLAKEKEAAAADTVAKIQGLFEGDEQCQMVILGWSEGLRGRELREIVGVDQPGLDYLIKKIRRKMNKLYPNGWQQ